MNPDTVLDVIEREQSHCAVCGLPVQGRGHVHHRKPRQIGGSRRRDRLSNLIYLHTDCHLRHVEQQRERAVQNGWIVQGDTDPAEAPIMYMLNCWVWLSDDGRITTEKENTDGTR